MPNQEFQSSFRLKDLNTQQFIHKNSIPKCSPNCIVKYSPLWYTLRALSLSLITLVSHQTSNIHSMIVVIRFFFFAYLKFVIHRIDEPQPYLLKHQINSEIPPKHSDRWIKIEKKNCEKSLVPASL